MRKKVGVIGAGSFGLTVASLLAENTNVLVYARRTSVVDEINQGIAAFSDELIDQIQATNSIEDLCSSCDLIFPAVPSKNFRGMIRSFAPYLKPKHIMIHCTKGFDVLGLEEANWNKEDFTKDDVQTMSQIILNESNIIRVGCLSGPNLAREIMEGLPTAAVVASEYDEVIRMGQKYLNSNRFFVFGSHDLLGAELAGALKNVIALGTGMLAGLQMGRNIQAMLITRGIVEMIHLGKAMGSESKAFLGTAGIGDLIATATSSKSRNYSVGYKLGQGQDLDSILKNMNEVAEGIRTLKIADQLCYQYQVPAPIIHILYKIVFKNFKIKDAINYLMRHPYAEDVDFL